MYTSNISRVSYFKKIMFAKYSSNSNDNDTNSRILKELFIYFLFLTVTTITTMSARGIDMFYFNDVVNRLFLQRSSDLEDALALEFSDIVTFGDWWTYLETTFVEGIEHFVDNNSVNSLFVDGNILLGPPRLRQIRVKNESCNIAEPFRRVFTTCYGQYSKLNEDKNEHLGTRHFKQSELNAYSLWGSVAKYHGGGYIQQLSKDKEENEKILAHLKEIVWIDSATRAVLFEFSIFNANVNLFCSAKLIAEIPATGGIITSSQLHSLRHSPIWNDGEYFKKIFFALFVTLITLFTVDTIRRIIRFGCITSVATFFNLCNIIILLVSYFSIGYVIWHTIYINSMLKKYSRNAEDHLSLDIICYWNLIFIDAVGVCVFIAWVQIFKYIKFNKTMLQFSRTLQKCAKDVLGFSIIFAIVLTAYSYLSILLFGSSLSDFRDFSSAFLTLMRMVLGDFDYERLEEANRILGPIFFLTFILFVFLILMNMFLAIINETYANVKSDVEIEKETQFEEYIKALLLNAKQFIMPPIKKTVDEEISSQGYKESVSANTSIGVQVKSKDSMKNLIKTKRDVIESVYEILPDHNEEDSLNERVKSVEHKMENLIKRLDLIIKLNESSENNTSNRSI